MELKIKKLNKLFQSRTWMLSKYFVFFFVFSFLAVNWSDVSWVFNYRVVSGVVFDSVQEIKVETNESEYSIKEKEVEISEFEYSSKENSLEVSKIGISVPLILAESSYQGDLQKDLDNGVVHFPDSVLPGEIGQTIILGHSAPLNWPKINYDWVFSEINQLEVGDDIIVYFNHKKYIYDVRGKIFLDKGEDLPVLTKYESVLMLISCWPPGKDIKRIAIEAHLIK